jgi:hypothetical protein
MEKSPLGFYGASDFNYEMSMIEEYWTVDNRYKVVLHSIDIVKSKVHSVYGEAKSRDKKFLAPVELSASVVIGQSTTKYLSGAGMAKEEVESFEFSVFISELEAKGVSIKRGDFVNFFDGKTPRIYEVTTVTNITTNNTAGGYKPFYVKCTGVLVKDDAIPAELIFIKA